ncbi:major vault protein-like [Rhopilema esculentum]|uniref:major vault protein-like n=1 Tax=Rhopilema esculentum TaxID=499914 RepID=UPI0031CED91A
MTSKNQILRLLPLQYSHILDMNTNITSLRLGPGTFILQDNEQVVLDPVQMVKVPPGHYCIIQNPAKLPVPSGRQCELKFGQTEVRFHQEPFPLYPGEVLAGGSYSSHKNAIKKLPVIQPKHGLRLQALVDFESGSEKRAAGDEWQLEGPLTYYPKPEERIMDVVKPHVIQQGEALRLKAKQDLEDHKGVLRVTGEEWLVKDLGAYLPGIYEEVIGVEQGYVLTEDRAIRMTATINCTDALGKKRIAGEEWLVTVSDKETYIPEVGEKLVMIVRRTVLGKHEFCIIKDPIDKDGKPQLGKKVMKRGITTFFLHPGEIIEAGVQKTFLLNEDEALIICAMEGFTDDTFGKDPIERKPGDEWLIRGPIEYVPRVETTVKEKRRAIPLDKNEGIYVQDAKSGQIRTEMGPQSYLLTEDERLWKKELPNIVEIMLKNGGCHGEGDIRKLAYFESSIDPEALAGRRNQTRVVKYRCPPNSAVQVYNHQKQTARVIFGPDLVSLGPDENFNVLSLSAGKPKKNNALKTLAVMLGPDFITDIIEVETLDHARLRIQYAVNNKFEYKKGDKESEARIFTVPDYIGFVCNSNASRIRGRVARTPFDEFHRYSARIVKEAIFGVDEDGNIRPSLLFKENNMIITNVDIQSIEPVDRQMRDSLLKSVQLAIEISTNSIERSAAHEAARTDQAARGSLERCNLQNEQAAEKARKHLYELRAITAAVESSGQAKAEAKARSERLLIEGQSEIEGSKLKAEAQEIEEEASLESLTLARNAELAYQKQMNALEIEKAKAISAIEMKRLKAMISSIGADTVSTIALAGPKSKIEMLKSLGIQSTLISDGSTPINLYQGGNGPFMRT